MVLSAEGRPTPWLFRVSILHGGTSIMINSPHWTFNTSDWFFSQEGTMTFLVNFLNSIYLLFASVSTTANYQHKYFSIYSALDWLSSVTSEQKCFVLLMTLLATLLNLLPCHLTPPKFGAWTNQIQVSRIDSLTFFRLQPGLLILLLILIRYTFSCYWWCYRWYCCLSVSTNQRADVVTYETYFHLNYIWEKLASDWLTPWSLVISLITNLYY